MKSINFVFLLLICSYFSKAQDKPAVDICSQLNLVINSSIHKFAEIKTSEKESSITLDGFPQNGYLTLDEKNYVEWGSRDMIYKKKKDMEGAFADFATKLGTCHFDAATLKIKYKLANEIEFDAITTTDPKFKTVRLHLAGGEKSNKKGQFYIYITVTNDYFENGYTGSKEGVEKKIMADNVQHLATLDSFKTALNAIINAEPDSFKAVLGAVNKDAVGTTYDCTAKLPGAENVFFRDELGIRAYQATYYEGIDSGAVEKTYKSLVDMLTQYLPSGYTMDDKKSKTNKHITTFSQTGNNKNKTSVILTETADRKDYYHLIMTIQ